MPASLLWDEDPKSFLYEHIAYAGWVPTITGQLSFSVVGRGGGLKRCVTANEDVRNSGALGEENVGHRRIVCALQRRHAHDLPYPKPVLRRVRPWIEADYIFLAHSQPAPRPILQSRPERTSPEETRAWRRRAPDYLSPQHEEQGVLTGSVFIVPHQKSAEARRQMRKLVAKLKRDFAAVETADDKNTDTGAAVKAYESAIEALAKAGPRVLSARVALFRSGEFRLSFDPGQLSRPRAPLGNASLAELTDALCAQMYYFVKDTAHRHYHHDAKTSDNLLPLTPVSRSDDTTWRQETLWSLVRAIVQLRRLNARDCYGHALGVLSYAEAFQILHATHRRSETNFDKFERGQFAAGYDFEHTRTSIEAKHEESTYVHASHSQMVALFISVFLASAAIWVSAVQLREPLCAHISAPASEAHAAPEASRISVDVVRTEGGLLTTQVQRHEPPNTRAQRCNEMVPLRSWSVNLFRHFITDPILIVALLLLVSFLYFEFASRGLRSTPIFAWAVRTPLRVLHGIGANVSRALVRVAPDDADFLGVGVAIILQVVAIYLVSWVARAALGF